MPKSQPLELNKAWRTELQMNKIAVVTPVMVSREKKVGESLGLEKKVRVDRSIGTVTDSEIMLNRDDFTPLASLRIRY